MGKTSSKASKLHNVLYKAENASAKTPIPHGKAAGRRVTPPGLAATTNPYWVGANGGTQQQDEVEGVDDYGAKGQGNLICVPEVALNEEYMHVDLFKTTPVLQTLSRQEIASRRPSFPLVSNQYYQ